MASIVQVVFLIDLSYLIENEVDLTNGKSKLYLCCLRLLTEFGAQTDKDNVRWSFKFYNSNKFKPDISHKIFYDFNILSLKKFEDELQNIIKKTQKELRSKSQIGCIIGPTDNSRGTSVPVDAHNVSNNNESFLCKGETSSGHQYSHSYILNKCLQEILFDYNWDRPVITSPVKDLKSFGSRKSLKHRGKSRKSNDTITNEDLNFVIVFTKIPKNLNDASKFIGQNSCSCSSDIIKNIFDNATLQGFKDEKKLRLHLINISKEKLDFTLKSSLQSNLNKIFGGVHEIDNLVNNCETKDITINQSNASITINQNMSSNSLFLPLSEHKLIKGTELGLTGFYWWNKKKILSRGRVPQPGPSLIWEDINGASFLKIPLEILSVQGSSSKQWDDIYVKGVVRGNAMNLLGIGLPSSLLYVCHAPDTAFPNLLSVLLEQNLFMILQLQNGGLVGLAPWVGGVGCLVLFSSTQLTSPLSRYKVDKSAGSENSLGKGLLLFVKSAIKKVLKNTPQLPEEFKETTVPHFQPQMIQSWYPCSDISIEKFPSNSKNSSKDQAMLQRLQKKYLPQMPRPLSGTNLPPPALIDVTQPSAAAAIPDSPSKSRISAAINISKFKVSRAQKLVKNSKIVTAQMKVREQQAEEELKAASERKTIEAQKRAKKSFAIVSKIMKKIDNPLDKDELARTLMRVRDNFEDTLEKDKGPHNSSSTDDIYSAAQSTVNLALVHIKKYFGSDTVQNELRDILSRKVLLSAKQVSSDIKENDQLRQFKLQVLLYLEVLWVLGYSRPHSLTPSKRKSPRKKKDIGEEYIEEILKILRTVSLKYDPAIVGEFLELLVVPNYQDSLGEILVEIFEELNLPLPPSLAQYANNGDDEESPILPLPVKSQVNQNVKKAPNSNEALGIVNTEGTRPPRRRLLRRETSNRQIIVPHVTRPLRRVNTVVENKRKEDNQNIKSVRRNLFDKSEKLKRSHTITAVDLIKQKTPSKTNSKKRKHSDIDSSPCTSRGKKSSSMTPTPKKAKILVPETPYHAAKITVFNKERLLKSTGSTTIIESPDIKGEKANSKNGSRRSSLPFSRRTSFYSGGSHSRNFEKGKLQIKLSRIKGQIEKRNSIISNASGGTDSSFIFSEILHNNSQIDLKSKKEEERKKSKRSSDFFPISMRLDFGLDEDEDVEQYRPSSGRKVTTPHKQRYPYSSLQKVRRSLSLVTPVKIKEDESKCQDLNDVVGNDNKNSPLKVSESSIKTESNGAYSSCKNLRKFSLELPRDCNPISSGVAFKDASDSPKESANLLSLNKRSVSKVERSPRTFSTDSHFSHINRSSKMEEIKNGINIDSSNLVKECSIIISPYKLSIPKTLNERKNSGTANNNKCSDISLSEKEGNILKNCQPDKVSTLNSKLCSTLTHKRSVESEIKFSDSSFLGFANDDEYCKHSRNSFDILKETLIKDCITPSKRVQFNLNETPVKQDFGSASKDLHIPKSILKTPQKSPLQKQSNVDNSNNSILSYTPKTKKLPSLKSSFIQSPSFAADSSDPSFEKEMPSKIMNRIFKDSTPTHFQALLNSPITSLEKNKSSENKKNIKNSTNSIMKSHRKLQMLLPSPKKLKSPEKWNDTLKEVLNSPKKSLMNCSTEFEIVSPLKKGFKAKTELVTYENVDENTMENVIRMSFQLSNEKPIKEPTVHQIVEKNGDQIIEENAEKFDVLEESLKCKIEINKKLDVLDSKAAFTIQKNESNFLVPSDKFLSADSTSMPCMTDDDLNFVAELLDDLEQNSNSKPPEFAQNVESFSRNSSHRGSDSGISMSVYPDYVDGIEKDGSNNMVKESAIKESINNLINSLSSPCKIKSKDLSMMSISIHSESNLSPKSPNENLEPRSHFPHISEINKGLSNGMYDEVLDGEIQEDSLVICSSDSEEDSKIEEFPDTKFQYFCESSAIDDYREENCDQKTDKDLEVSPIIPLSINMEGNKIYCEEEMQDTGTKRKLFQNGDLETDHQIENLEEENFQFIFKRRKISEVIALPPDDETIPLLAKKEIANSSCQKCNNLSKDNIQSGFDSKEQNKYIGNTIKNSLGKEEDLTDLSSSKIPIIELEKCMCKNFESKGNNLKQNDKSPVNSIDFILSSSLDTPVVESETCISKSLPEHEESNLKLNDKNPLGRSSLESNVSCLQNGEKGTDTEVKFQDEDSNNHCETKADSNLIDVETVSDDLVHWDNLTKHEPCFSPIKNFDNNLETNDRLSYNSPSGIYKIQPDSNLTPRRSNRKSKQTAFYESPVNLENNYGLFSPVFNSRKKKANTYNTSRKLYDVQNEIDNNGFKDSHITNVQMDRTLLGVQRSSNPSTSQDRISDDSFEIVSPQKNVKIFEEEEKAGIPEEQKTPIIIKIRKKKKTPLTRQISLPPLKSERASKLKAMRSIKSEHEIDEEIFLEDF